MDRRVLPLIAAALATTLGTTQLKAQSADPTVAELKETLRRLQERVDQLESAASRPTPQQVDATRDAIRTDVERKAAANAVGVTYDKGLVFKTGDPDAFSLKANILSQFRYTATLGNSDRRNDEAGFEFRRVRPGITGNVLSKDLGYAMVLDVNRDTGNVTLYDLYFQYKFDTDFGVKFGQFKQSLTHENDVSDSRQLAVERSVAETVIGANGRVERVQGIALTYGGNKDNPFRAEFAFTDGGNSGIDGTGRDFRNGNTPSVGSTSGTTNRNYGTGARAEYKVTGDWANYTDFTAKGTKETLFVIGAGLDRTERGSREVYTGGIDAQLETPDGWTFYAAGLANYNDNSISPTNTLSPNSDDFTYGAVGQVGYLLNPSVELFGRGGITFFDNSDRFSNNATSLSSTNDYFPEVTIGANYFLGRDGSWLHNAKFTADFTYLPNGYPISSTGTGVLANDDAEYVFRIQFQLIL